MCFSSVFPLGWFFGSHVAHTCRDSCSSHPSAPHLLGRQVNRLELLPYMEVSRIYSCSCTWVGQRYLCLRSEAMTQRGVHVAVFSGVKAWGRDFIEPPKYIQVVLHVF